MDSKMEDTPANYNIPNQRFDGQNNTNETGEEYDDDYGVHMAPDEIDDGFLPGGDGKRRRKKKKITTVEVLQPTERDKNMAGAYGG